MVINTIVSFIYASIILCIAGGVISFIPALVGEKWARYMIRWSFVGFVGTIVLFAFGKYSETKYDPSQYDFDTITAEANVETVLSQDNYIEGYTFFGQEEFIYYITPTPVPPTPVPHSEWLIKDA